MIGDRLKEFRTKNNLSQEDLSARLHVSRSLVAKWEQGRANPTSEDLDKMAELFSVKPEDLASYRDLKAIYKDQGFKYRKNAKVFWWVFGCFGGLLVLFVIGESIAMSNQTHEMTLYGNEDYKIGTIEKSDDGSTVNKISFEGTDLALTGYEAAQVPLILKDNNMIDHVDFPQNNLNFLVFSRTIAERGDSVRVYYETIQTLNGFGGFVSAKKVVTSVQWNRFAISVDQSTRGVYLDFGGLTNPFNPDSESVAKFQMPTFLNSQMDETGGDYGRVRYNANWGTGYKKTSLDGLNFLNAYLSFDVDCVKLAKKRSLSYDSDIDVNVVFITESGTSDLGYDVFSGTSSREWVNVAGDGYSCQAPVVETYWNHFAGSSELTKTDWVPIAFMVSSESVPSAESYDIKEFDSSDSLIKTTTISSISEASAYTKQNDMFFAIVYKNTVSGKDSGTKVNVGGYFPTFFSNDYGLFYSNQRIIF